MPTLLVSSNNRWPEFFAIQLLLYFKDAPDLYHSKPPTDVIGFHKSDAFTALLAGLNYAFRSNQTSGLRKRIGQLQWEVVSEKSQSFSTSPAKLNTCQEYCRLNHQTVTVGVSLFDDRPLVVNPVGLAFQLIQWLIDAVLYLFLGIRIFVRKLGVVYVPLARGIKVVQKIMDLPVFEHCQLIQSVLQLIFGNVAIFILIKLLKKSSYLCIILFALHLLQTVQSNILIVILRLGSLWMQNPNSSVKSFLRFLWRLVDQTFKILSPNLIAIIVFEVGGETVVVVFIKINSVRLKKILYFLSKLLFGQTSSIISNEISTLGVKFFELSQDHLSFGKLLLILKIGGSSEIKISWLLIKFGFVLLLDIKVILKILLFMKNTRLLNIFLLSNGAQQSLDIKIPFLILKFEKQLFSLCLRHHQIVNVQLFHHIVKFIFIDLLSSHAVYSKGFFQLTKFISQNQVHLLIEVLSPAIRLGLQFQSPEVDIVLSHELDKVVDSQPICSATGQPENELSFILINIVSILLDNSFKFFSAYPAFRRIVLKVIAEISLSVVIFDKSFLELIQLENVNLFTPKLTCYFRNLFVQAIGIVQFGNRTLELPLSFHTDTFGFTIPPFGFHFNMCSLEGIARLEIFHVRLGSQGLGCFIIAGL